MSYHDNLRSYKTSSRIRVATTRERQDPIPDARFPAQHHDSLVHGYVGTEDRVVATTANEPLFVSGIRRQCSVARITLEFPNAEKRVLGKQREHRSQVRILLQFRYWSPVLLLRDESIVSAVATGHFKNIFRDSLLSN